MTWNASFRDQLESTQQAPLFQLQLIANGTTSAEGVGSGFTTGSFTYSIPYSTSTGATRSAVTVAASIVAGSVSITGQQVTVQSWSSTIGTFSVILAGETEELFEAATRGSLCRLLMGFHGMGLEDFEPVALGVVQNIRGTGGIMTIDCWDLLSALQSRITSDSTKLSLYSDVVQATTIASSAYSAGAGTLTLASATGFTRETGGTGVVKVTPDSGDPFYLKWTNIVGVVLTVEAVGSFGTTAANASIGNAVENAVYLTGHPLILLEKTLASTGTGGNGSRDTLPSTWGYGVSKDWLDTQSLDNWRSEVLQAASGAYTWDVLIEAPVTNGFSFWSELLSRAGIWPVLRHGKLAARCAQDITLGSAKVHTVAITDEDIVSVDRYSAFDTAAPQEAGKTKVIPAASGDAATATSTTLSTLPGVEVIEHDLSAVVWANQAAIVTSDANRLKIWDQRIGERVELTLGGLKGAQFVPGDVVLLTSTALKTRLGAVSGDGYVRSRRALVTSVEPKLMGATVVVELVMMPTASEE